MIWVLVLIFWVVCGVLSFGYELAYFHIEWPPANKSDIWHVLIFSGFGPFSLLSSLVLKHTKHGLMFRIK